MSLQSKFYQVTPQVLLEYRTDQYDITTTHRANGKDSSSVYVYQAQDGNIYCVEKDNIPNTKYPMQDRSNFYFGGKAIKDFDLDIASDHPIVGSDILINDENIGVIVKDKNGNELRQVELNHDTIRLYLISGYVMNSIGGYSVAVKGRISNVSANVNGETLYKQIDEYMYLLDWFMPKGELKDLIHWLPSPLYMNSKFYDRYIEIKFPSPLDIALSDRGIDYIHQEEDEDGNPIFMRGRLDPSSNFIVEFVTSQPYDIDNVLETTSMYECKFKTDSPKIFSISRQSNATNFNIRLYEDLETRSIIYYPVYGDSTHEQDFDIAMMQAIESGIISMYDSADANIVNNGMDDFMEMYGTDSYQWVIINELTLTYNYENINGQGDTLESHSEYFTNTIDYSGKTEQHGEFYKSKIIPYIKHRNNLNCRSIIVSYTAHLYNRMNNIDIVRNGSMLIDEPYKYMSQLIDTKNIVSYKIVNKIAKNDIKISTQAVSDQAEKMVRSYYNATDIIVKDMTSGQVYTQGKMTMRLNHSGNNYMLRLYTNNADNTRVPYDLTGTMEYKLVFPSANGSKIEILPNKDSTNYNLGIGSLIFYIPSDKSKAIMDVPTSERYFALTTHIPTNPTEESTLYEGNVEWTI